MISCAVFGCNNSTLTTTDPSIQYYFFPKHTPVVQQWLAACSWKENQIDPNTGFIQNASSRKTYTTSSVLARICSVHFANDSYTSEFKFLDHLGCYTKILKYDAVPTLYLPSSAQDIPHKQLEPRQLNDLRPVQGGNPEKYDCVQNSSQLNSLRQQNEELQKEIEALNSTLSELEDDVQIKHHKYQELIDECHSIRSKHTSLKICMMSVQQQKNMLARVFSESQIKILSGKKKIYWSNDDMAMGYTLRHMSNKRCYTYLSKHLNIPLPALSSIKRWATVKKADYKVKEEKRSDVPVENVAE